MNNADATSAIHALKVLARTRELLASGRRWRANKTASGRFGIACDPLSQRAYHFSLVGAAARAAWEMQHEHLDLEEGEIRIVHILQAMSSVPSSPYSGEMGWRHVDSILTGLEAALREYQENAWASTEALQA